MGNERKLTSKQIKFIEAYSGNATEAARLAGYKGNEDTLRQVGAENIAKPYILEAIKSREAKTLEPIIANRKARQEFWTKLMNDSFEKSSDRLKASELLGKSEADFTDNLNHSGSFKLEGLTDPELDKRIEELMKKQSAK